MKNLREALTQLHTEMAFRGLMDMDLEDFVYRAQNIIDSYPISWPNVVSLMNRMSLQFDMQASVVLHYVDNVFEQVEQEMAKGGSGE